MPIETATYINTLVPANPLDTDQEGQGAAHMRLIKATLQSTFPNVVGPVTATDAQLSRAGTAFTSNTVTVPYDTPSTAATLALGSATAGTNAATVQAASGGLTLSVTNTAGTALQGALQLPQGGGAVVPSGNVTASAGNFFSGTTPISFIGEVRLFAYGVASIPTGWHLCDGTSGTPDLRDRFVVGAGNSYAPGATGGLNTNYLSVAQMPSHSHGISDPGHGHSVNDPGHLHGLTVPNGVGVASGPYGGWAGNGGAGTNTSTSTTGVSINGAGTGISVQSTGSGSAIENRPPFYAIVFIMRVA